MLGPGPSNDRAGGRKPPLLGYVHRWQRKCTSQPLSCDIFCLSQAKCLPGAALRHEAESANNTNGWGGRLRYVFWRRPARFHPGHRDGLARPGTLGVSPLRKQERHDRNQIVTSHNKVNNTPGGQANIERRPPHLPLPGRIEDMHPCHSLNRCCYRNVIAESRMIFFWGIASPSIVHLEIARP
jgi:hypothetical protein